MVNTWRRRLRISWEKKIRMWKCERKKITGAKRTKSLPYKIFPEWKKTKNTETEC